MSQSTDRSTRVRYARAALFIVRTSVLLCTLAFVLTYVTCALLRMRYPWDIEWMEGGMLSHAARVLRGEPIYAKPSLDFVSFFYTPLYPWVVAALAKLFGLSFALGRVVSFAASLAIMAQLFYAGRRERGPLVGLLAVGLYAALFRTCGAFYDLGRADSLSLALALGAALLAYYQTDMKSAALSAALFVAAFFCKQTTALIAPFVGLYLLGVNWRRAALFGATGIALGAAWGFTLDAASEGWFSFYTVQGHQGHAFNAHAFFLAYWRDVLCLCPILWLLPAFGASYGRSMRWAVPPFLLLLGAASEQRLSALHESQTGYGELWYRGYQYAVLLVPLAIATLLYAARMLGQKLAMPSRFFGLLFVGASIASDLNHSTDWAYTNCYMPLAVFGSLFAALCAATLFERPERLRSAAAAICVGAALITQFVALYYDPSRQVPSVADRAAAAQLEETLASFPGPIMVPAHPLYAFRRDGTVHIHQMGIQDVGFAGGVSDLESGLREGRFKTVVTDNITAVPGLEQHYVRALEIPYEGEALLCQTGLRVRPSTVWLHRSLIR